jgi:predicted  nucleic acid-binding Zn-ribbon protein
MPPAEPMSSDIPPGEFIREMRQARVDFCRHIDDTFGGLRDEVRKIAEAIVRQRDALADLRAGMHAGFDNIDAEILALRGRIRELSSEL